MGVEIGARGTAQSHHHKALCIYNAVPIPKAHYCIIVVLTCSGCTYTLLSKETNAIQQNSRLLDFFEFDTIAHAHRHLCIYHNAVTSSKAKNGIIVVLT